MPCTGMACTGRRLGLGRALAMLCGVPGAPGAVEGARGGAPFVICRGKAGARGLALPLGPGGGAPCAAGAAGGTGVGVPRKLWLGTNGVNECAGGIPLRLPGRMPLPEAGGPAISWLWSREYDFAMLAVREMVADSRLAAGSVFLLKTLLGPNVIAPDAGFSILPKRERSLAGTHLRSRNSMTSCVPDEVRQNG
jgi:hypothetical protein